MNEFIFCRYANRELIPVRVSKEKNTDRNMDLLLLTDGRKYHYVLITKLVNLVNRIRGRTLDSRTAICRNCFHVCSTEEYLIRHQQLCYHHEAAVIRMPTEENNSLVFNKAKSKSVCPVVAYFDLESLVLPVSTCSGDPSTSHTRVVEKHEPSGFCLSVIETSTMKQTAFHLDRSPGCMQNFVKKIEELAKDMHERKQKFKQFRGVIDVPKEQATECWICENIFLDNDEKVLDHCHYSGKFLGWAHSKCNLDRKTDTFVPIVAHNLSNYDMHHLCRALHASDEKNILRIIPNTDEKYISLTLSVHIRTYTRKDGKETSIYENMRFIDSCRFMPSSLDKLVSYLPPDGFKIINDHFSSTNALGDIELLHKKGFYPYSYMDSFDKFKEKTLPPLPEWKNTLKNGEIALNEEQLEQAKNVYKTFKCSNLGDYHDLYLVTDTLLLACVFEKFRKTCQETYGLDCARYFSAPNLAGDAFLKICGEDIELLTQREHLDIAEELMRGGMASVYAKRIFKANNKYLKTWLRTLPSVFGFLIDANNLYGGIMQKFPLPLGGFCTVNDTPLEVILQTTIDSAVGYIVECDLKYPSHLHDLHKDFPLAPTKEAVDPLWLSEYQINLMQSMNASCSFKARKLLQTLWDKKNYTLHYLTLQLYVNLGLEVTRVHRVLKFKQKKWLQSYIDLNTKMRQRSKNAFDKNFFKLMSNSAYGKTCESKRNRQKIFLVRCLKDLLDKTSQFALKSYRIFTEELAAVTLKQTVILWNKPTIVGATILDLAKMVMFKFHYLTMKKLFSCTLLYSDTDSLTYAVECEDLYKELEENTELQNEFDFSNYARESKLFSEHNKMETLKFKDELGGEVMEEFVCLKPKMYSILTNG